MKISKIEITDDEGNKHHFTIDEARQMYEALKGIFGPRLPVENTGHKSLDEIMRLSQLRQIHIPIDIGTAASPSNG